MAIIHKAEIKQINFLDERFYTKDNVIFYPSVTTVLEALPKGFGYSQWVKDLGHNADEVMRRAGESGTRVHKAIEQYLLGNEVVWANENGYSFYNWEEWQMINKFVDFWETYKPKLIACELTMISDALKIGGTIDIICLINDQLWLIDTKTSNSVYDSHALQLSAYVQMWNETKIENKIQRFGIMWLKALTRGSDKFGKKIQGNGWQIKEFEETQEKLFDSFCDVRRIWDRQNPNYKPKYLCLPDRLKLNN